MPIVWGVFYSSYVLSMTFPSMESAMKNRAPDTIIAMGKRYLNTILLLRVETLLPLLISS